MKILASVAVAIAVIACIWAILPRGERPGEADPTPHSPDVATVAPPPSDARNEPAPPPNEPSPEPIAPAKEDTIPPGASLAGTVRTEEGDPVTGAEVYLVVHPAGGDRDLLGSGRLGEGYFQCSRSRVAITGDDGSYRMDALSWTGPSTVSVFAAGLAGAQQHVELEAETKREDLNFTLPPGRTLLGRVVTGTGEPVADALVSVGYAWHPKDMAWGSSLGPTDADGRFALGFAARAEMCSLRVNSESLGQDFFLNIRIPEGEEVVELRLHDTATIHGVITWADGAPATGVFVAARAEVPEPDIPVWYSGMRPSIFVEEAVDEDGRYEIDGLYPGLSYNVYVLPEGEDRLAAHRSPLSPQWKNRFTPEPGEVKTWDYTVPLPIVVRGRVITDLTSTPVPRMEVGVLKDGKSIHELTAQCDEEGRFELPINTGPGEYRIHARSSSGHEGPASLIAERYGQTLVLRGGDAVTVELRVFEPIVLPIRVLDSEGAPVQSIRTQLDFQTPDGKRYGVGDSRSLQEDGRSRVLLYFPVKQLSLEVGLFPSGPMTEKQVFEAEPGTVLPEATFHLPRVCTVTAVLVGPDGAPYAKQRVTLDVEYAGGIRERASAQTDEDGRLSIEGRVRATVLDLEIRVDEVEGTWRATGLDSTGGDLDLGPIQVPSP